MSWIFLVLCIIDDLVMTRQEKNYSGGLNGAFVRVGLEISFGGSCAALGTIMFAN